MPTTTILILATATVSVLAVIAFLWRLWVTSLRFPARTVGRSLALAYAVVVTSFGAFIIWLIVGWVQQALNAGATGDPGPVILVLFLVAAAAGCFPSMVGLALMPHLLRRHQADTAAAHF